MTNAAYTGCQGPRVIILITRPTQPQTKSFFLGEFVYISLLLTNILQIGNGPLLCWAFDAASRMLACARNRSHAFPTHLSPSLLIHSLNTHFRIPLHLFARTLSYLLTISRIFAMDFPPLLGYFNVGIEPTVLGVLQAASVIIHAMDIHQDDSRYDHWLMSQMIRRLGVVGEDQRTRLFQAIDRMRREIPTVAEDIPEWVLPFLQDLDPATRRHGAAAPAHDEGDGSTVSSLDDLPDAPSTDSRSGRFAGWTMSSGTQLRTIEDTDEAVESMRTRSARSIAMALLDESADRRSGRRRRLAIEIPPRQRVYTLSMIEDGPSRLPMPAEATNRNLDTRTTPGLPDQSLSAVRRAEDTIIRLRSLGALPNREHQLTRIFRSVSGTTEVESSVEGAHVRVQTIVYPWPDWYPSPSDSPSRLPITTAGPGEEDCVDVVEDLMENIAYFMHPLSDPTDEDIRTIYCLAILLLKDLGAASRSPHRRSLVTVLDMYLDRLEQLEGGPYQILVDTVRYFLQLPRSSSAGTTNPAFGVTSTPTPSQQLPFADSRQNDRHPHISHGRDYGDQISQIFGMATAGRSSRDASAAEAHHARTTPQTGPYSLPVSLNAQPHIYGLDYPTSEIIEAMASIHSMSRAGGDMTEDEMERLFWITSAMSQYGWLSLESPYRHSVAEAMDRAVQLLGHPQNGLHRIVMSNVRDWLRAPRVPHVRSQAAAENVSALQRVDEASIRLSDSASVLSQTRNRHSTHHPIASNHLHQWALASIRLGDAPYVDPSASLSGRAEETGSRLLRTPISHTIGLLT